MTARSMTTRSMTARELARSADNTVATTLATTLATTVATTESRPASHSMRIEEIDENIEAFVRGGGVIRRVVRESLCKELRLYTEDRWLEDWDEASLAQFEIKHAKFLYAYRNVIDMIAGDIMITADQTMLFNIMTGQIEERLFIHQLYAITKYMHYHD